MDYTVSGLGDDEGVVISGLDLNYVVEIVSEEGFERFTVTNTGEGNEQFDIGRLTFSRDIINTDAEEIGSLIQIDDSGPTIAATGPAPELTVDDSGLPNGTDAGNPTSPTVDSTDQGAVAAAFTSSFGADCDGTISYALSIPDHATDSQLNELGNRRRHPAASEHDDGRSRRLHCCLERVGVHGCHQ